MSAIEARRHLGAPAIVLIAAAALWLVTYAWFWGPFWIAHQQGQQILYPFALLAQAVVLVLTVVALVLAIAGAARRTLPTRQSVVVIVVSAIFLCVGPLWLWFGTFPPIQIDS